MTEEQFKREDADELTCLIANRLGERQEKLNRIDEWEQAPNRSASVKPLYAMIAAAACIVAVMLFWPTHQSPLDELGIATPTLTEYRSATSGTTSIGQLIANKKYDEALQLTKKALNQSDLTVQELSDIPELWENDEEMDYENNLEQVKNAELRWTYIYLLIRTGKDKEAIKELKRYLKHPQYCEHKEEARKLLEKLK